MSKKTTKKIWLDRRDLSAHLVNLFYDGIASYRPTLRCPVYPAGLDLREKKWWRSGFHSARKNLENPPPCPQVEAQCYNDALLVGAAAYQAYAQTKVPQANPFNADKSGDILDEARSTGWIDGMSRAASGISCG
jgi:hypothetical protein